MVYRGCNELSTLPAPRSWAIDWLLSGARTVDYYWVCSSYTQLKCPTNCFLITTGKHFLPRILASIKTILESGIVIVTVIIWNLHIRKYNVTPQ